MSPSPLSLREGVGAKINGPQMDMGWGDVCAPSQLPECCSSCQQYKVKLSQGDICHFEEDNEKKLKWNIKRRISPF